MFFVFNAIAFETKSALFWTFPFRKPGKITSGGGFVWKLSVQWWPYRQILYVGDRHRPIMFAVEETGGEQRRSPPVKVLSGQLRAAGNRAAADRDGGAGFVIRAGRGRSLRASLVWMQGTVMEAHLERNTVLLMDETGTFTVQGVNNVPRGKPCLFPGKKIKLK